MKILDVASETHPLHFAIANSLIDNVRLLIECGEDVNTKDGKGKTPIMICSMIHNESIALGIARMLLQNGANTSTVDSYKRNALMYSILFQKSSFVLLLIKALDASINQKDLDGNTPLHHAVTTGNFKITKSIIYEYLKQNESLDCANKHFETPIENAVKLGHADIVNVFIKNGIKLKRITIKKSNSIEAFSFDNSKQHLMQITNGILESCREHRSSSQFNIHQFRRNVMKKYKNSNEDEFLRREIQTTIYPKKNNRVSKSVASSSSSSNSYKSNFAPTMRKTSTPNRNWKTEIPKVWNVYKEHLSPSYRPPAKVKSQSYEEAMEILFPADNDSQTECSEDDNFLKPSRHHLSRRRNTTVYRRSGSISRSRTRSAGNVEMMNAITAARSLLSDDQSSINSGASLKRKNKKGGAKRDSFSDSASSSSGSSTMATAHSKQTKLNEKSKVSKNRPASAVKNIPVIATLPSIQENGCTENDSETKKTLEPTENNNKEHNIVNKTNQFNNEKNSFESDLKSSSSTKEENGANNLSSDLSSVVKKNNRRQEIVRNTPFGDKVLSDISEESSIVSDYTQTKQAAGVIAVKIESKKQRLRTAKKTK